MNRGIHHAVTALGVCLALVLPAAARADDGAVVPVELQAELIHKTARYDRALPGRAGAQVVVLVLVKDGVADSSRVAVQLTAALQRKDTLAGLPHLEEIVSFRGGAALAAKVTSAKAAILYLTPGFSDAEVAEVVSALGETPLLTIGGVERFVRSGVVLGFELVSSKPRLVYHTAQARKHGIDFAPGLVNLMVTYP